MSQGGDNDIQARRRQMPHSAAALLQTNNADSGPRPPPNGTPVSSNAKEPIFAAITQAVLPEWVNLVAIVGLIFGGCCSNVYALEALIKAAPGSGTLVTCFQFVLIAVLTLPSHLDLSRGIKNLYLKRRAVPFTRWLVYTAFFVTINILNNTAFRYKISVPLHIILRSAGPVATMIIQRLAGKRSSETKMAAVLLLFIGVITAALADAMSRSQNVRLVSTSVTNKWDFWIGFAILYVALVLSAILGIFTDRTYVKYGRGHTDEILFYSHGLSLPFFLLQSQALRNDVNVLLASPASIGFFSTDTLDKTPFLIRSGLQLVPVQAFFLVMNGLTQYLCIRGVNLLSARTSSLTVAIILNIRKLVSLLLSIWLFGNRLAPGVLLGAGLVFLGGALYAIPDNYFAFSKARTESKKDL